MADKSAVVTGASTGIGLSIATNLTKRGFHVFGTVRKPADADRLQAALGPAFTPVILDVTDQAAVQQAAAQVREHLGCATLAGLVNNAGIAVGGPLIHLPLDQLRHQLEVNLVAPLLVTQAFAPLLGVDRARQGAPGRIINISSVAGKLALPFAGPYVASKHALEGLSASLRRELLLYGIDVIVVAPGAVVTPIWDKAESFDPELFRHTDYVPMLERFGKYFVTEGRKGLPAQAIADTVYTALTASKPKVRYAIVPSKFKNWTLPRLLPSRLLDRLIGKQTGLLPS